MVVPGTLDGSPHFWNVVRTESGYRHLDLTRGADSRGQYPLLSDREMAALGYQWDTQAAPPCGEPSDSQEGTGGGSRHLLRLLRRGGMRSFSIFSFYA